MELAIKWMYSVDTSLSMPYQEKLVTLLNTEGFQKIVGREILKRLNFIRALGNSRPQYPRHQQGAGTVCTGKPVRFPRFR